MLKRCHFCWQPLEECHKLVCGQEADFMGHVMQFLFATQRDGVRVWKLTGPR